MPVDSHSATAVAHPNIALSKYWGKRPHGGNIPAVPSLSVTLAGMMTRTTVRFAPDLREDRLVMGGVEQAGEPLARARGLLDTVRRAAGFGHFAEVTSYNDFPTASGIASSASGFAALALAAVRAASLPWDDRRVSDLARRTSASSARSLFGGYVELVPAADASHEDLLSAEPVAAPEHMDMRVIVCVTSEGRKSVSSTAGMAKTQTHSPYYPAWLLEAGRIHDRIRAAVLSADFEQVGEWAEASAMAMHASAIAAGIVYWNAGTVEALSAVRELRRGGALAFATIDAGPHVKVLVSPSDHARATDALAKVPGVLRLIQAHPGRGARIVTEGATE